MRIHIHALRHAEDLEEMLRAAGWRLDRTGTAGLYAQHPNVKGPADARSELDKLGLLTSPQVRIEFGPSTAI
jgi:hypothetical protein